MRRAKSLRTMNGLERFNEEFRRRVRTPRSPPNETSVRIPGPDRLRRGIDSSQLSFQ